MSRKQQPKDPSGFVFDARSGAVRAQGSSSENMKEKVQAVRAVVPNRSNTEIVLVLQHFDNAVERAVHAFVEGNASEVLKEWTVTGKKKNKKKKAKSQPGPSPPLPESWEKLGTAGRGMGGCHGNHGGRESPGTPREPGEPGAVLGNGIPNFPKQSQIPTPTRSSPGSPGGKKMGPSLEKSLKELQRCRAGLGRLRALLREQGDNSLRRARAAFGDIHGCLMDREVALLAEMDKVKAEAMQLLALRLRRAEALRDLTEAAPGMSEEQLQELRADIKHFVSERKFDEELGRAGRFGCDLQGLRESIGAFGKVSHPRPSYSSRSRCSSGPAIPTGSAPGSAPGSPEESAAPQDLGFGTFPLLPQRSRNPPGSCGPSPSPQRPPGIPKNLGDPKRRPGPPGKPRRSRPEGANS
ncbi:spermatogenesis-associated serine-rich protein 2 [Cinclus cinclus]|uniref:spermatogenesis-associated serine-rich protein 2 n=1 Tax=Cinclus cinclus TaxID=127875 RepID=UPI002E0E0578